MKTADFNFFDIGQTVWCVHYLNKHGHDTTKARIARGSVGRIQASRGVTHRPIEVQLQQDGFVVSYRIRIDEPLECGQAWIDCTDTCVFGTREEAERRAAGEPWEDLHE